MVYVAGRVAYDGTAFHGFQIQRDEPTIQGELESALFSCCGEFVRVHGSGRTDTGVHASGQVVAAQVPWRHTLWDLQRAWNAHLPIGITVRDLVVAPVDFHPRFSAESRVYRYMVYDVGIEKWQNTVISERRALPKASPLTDRFALYLPQLLDLDAMQAAAQLLVGEHDFATFGQPPQGENTVRTIFAADWCELTCNLPGYIAPGRCLVFTVRANAFLRHMVRNLVGTLLAIGKAEYQADYITELLVACDRRRCAPPAPPQGLVLMGVEYPSVVDPWQRADDGSGA